MHAHILKKTAMINFNTNNYLFSNQLFTKEANEIVKFQVCRKKIL